MLPWSRDGLVGFVEFSSDLAATMLAEEEE
jgi:hypothetical protein